MQHCIGFSHLGDPKKQKKSGPVSVPSRKKFRLLMSSCFLLAEDLHIYCAQVWQKVLFITYDFFYVSQIARILPLAFGVRIYLEITIFFVLSLYVCAVWPALHYWNEKLNFKIVISRLDMHYRLWLEYDVFSATSI